MFEHRMYMHICTYTYFYLHSKRGTLTQSPPSRPLMAWVIHQLEQLIDLWWTKNLQEKTQFLPLLQRLGSPCYVVKTSLLFTEAKLGKEEAKFAGKKQTVHRVLEKIPNPPNSLYFLCLKYMKFKIHKVLMK